MNVLFLLFTLWSDQVVTNDIQPTGKALSVTYERELRIGPESGEDAYVWTGASVMVAVNKAGHMFVMDRGGLRIIELDETGKFVRQIGAQGEGPGEFVRLTNLCVLDDQSLVATESRQGATMLNFFDARGDFLRRMDTTAMGRNFTSSKFSPNGKLISATYYQLTADGGGQKMGYGVLDERGELLVDLGQHDMPRADRNRLKDPAFWSEYMAAWFALQPNQGLVAFGADGAVFTANAGKYEITRYRSDLKEKLTFNKRYKPRFQSPEDQAALVEPMRQRVLANLPGYLHTYISDGTVQKALVLAGLPERQTPVIGLVPMEDGAVLVVTDYDPHTQKAMADFFDAEGKFRGRSPLPDPEIDPFGSYNNLNVKMWFRNGKAYTIEDVEGEYILNRYSYRVGQL